MVTDGGPTCTTVVPYDSGHLFIVDLHTASLGLDGCLETAVVGLTLAGKILESVGIRLIPVSRDMTVCTNRVKTAVCIDRVKTAICGNRAHMGIEGAMLGVSQGSATALISAHLFLKSFILSVFSSSVRNPGI